MSYMESLERLGDSTEREVSRLFSLYTAGSVTRDEFVDLATVAVSLGQQQGRAMAEVSLLAWLDAAGVVASPVAAQPIAHYTDSERVRKALHTVMGAGVLEPDVIEKQLRRLSFSETVESSQRAFAKAMHESGQVEGWTRGVETGACELCIWWEADGRVWPTEHSMPTHKGCVCTPIPQTPKRVGTVKREGREMSSVRAAKGSYKERQESGYMSSSNRF